MARKTVPDFSLVSAARAFFQATATQSAEHIKPLHRYVAARLVFEGGFLPEDIHPRPPLAASNRGGHWFLDCDTTVASDLESIVLGGLKSKRVDVVVNKARIGPVLAVSLKGTHKAFRNLVNRTEEAIGDCANIHLMYPGLVFGFLHFLKATDASDTSLQPNDISMDTSGHVVMAIQAYAKILESLTGRKLVRNDYSRYEASGMALIMETSRSSLDPLVCSFPAAESVLNLNVFFTTLYDTYDLRFPYTYTDPGLKHLRRVAWHPDSPAIREFERQRKLRESMYSPRISSP